MTEGLYAQGGLSHDDAEEGRDLGRPSVDGTSRQRQQHEDDPTAQAAQAWAALDGQTGGEEHRYRTLDELASTAPYRKSSETSASSRSKSNSFLDEILPPPGHPDTARRVLSVAIISGFLLVVVFLAASSATSIARDANATDWIGSWVYDDWPVSMGDSSPRYSYSGASSDAEAQASSPAKVADDFSTNATNATATVASDTPGNAFVWHESLDWSLSNARGRLIVVGDVHGMVDSLKSLLQGLDFQPDEDQLILVGDLVAKHPSVNASLATVAYARSVNASIVRGNHDDKVVAWREWMQQQVMLSASNADNATSVNQLSMLDSKDLPDDVQVPDDWREYKWQSQHFQIARQMSSDDAAWLAASPLTLHIPSLHSYVVHAGLMPFETLSGRHAKEANVGRQDVVTAIDQSAQLGDYFAPSRQTRESMLESAESALLLVPDNRDAFALMNMRGIRHNTEVTKSSKHTPWHELYNDEMGECQRTYSSDRLRLRRRSAAPSWWNPLSWSGSQPVTDDEDEETIAMPDADSEASSDDSPASEVANEDVLDVQNESGSSSNSKMDESDDADPDKADNKDQSADESDHGLDYPDSFRPGSQANSTLASAQNVTIVDPTHPNDTDTSGAISSDRDTDEASEASSSSDEAVTVARADCQPVNVIYGHWAKEGLQLNEYTIGLDAGCVYGRRLAAMVVNPSGGSSASISHDLRKEDSITLADTEATIYSFACTAPDGDDSKPDDS
ncbi:uncharacterized protein L969DRAFT_90184 [Mixia osmundae IAM 14324]|uniref:Calcineurin-like phosphoesterase domain-containing protein n=1 Tax=Mixia osmundae (strain CBS 9802 / IAM 14324 / JCM 22182 / KY 12970) TaxID=764103 RepID=G7DSV5_MIXOS|nr:uncharacterized protein L969DRAFT_90184 [Mixia osmundae IAM 14324]KEI37121.1 hypothetical protein L969DRAFT_90184 [Mixia osmundae IAM 14324]GAA93665.1 hypothetical protein E5Q_00310 [Mixia osmundae IAM 14324]